MGDKSKILVVNTGLVVLAVRTIKVGALQKYLAKFAECLPKCNFSNVYVSPYWLRYPAMILFANKVASECFKVNIKTCKHVKYFKHMQCSNTKEFTTT